MELKRAAIGTTEREENKAPCSVVRTAKPEGEESGEITEEKAGGSEPGTEEKPACASVLKGKAYDYFRTLLGQ